MSTHYPRKFPTRRTYLEHTDEVYFSVSRYRIVSSMALKNCLFLLVYVSFAATHSYSWTKLFGRGGTKQLMFSIEDWLRRLSQYASASYRPVQPESCGTLADLTEFWSCFGWTKCANTINTRANHVFFCSSSCIQLRVHPVFRSINGPISKWWCCRALHAAALLVQSRGKLRPQRRGAMWISIGLRGMVEPPKNIK